MRTCTQPQFSFGRSMEIQIYGMDRWMSPPVEWAFHGVTLRWQLPILQRWRWSPHQWNGQMDVPSSWVSKCFNEKANFALAASHSPKKMKTSMYSQEVLKKGGLCPQTLNQCKRIGWFSPTEERDHQNIEKLTALFVVMPIHYLYIWKCEMWYKYT